MTMSYEIEDKCMLFGAKKGNPYQIASKHA